MKYIASPWAIVIFVMFVSLVLWISYYFARRTKSAAGYFAAGGTIHWAVNGIAFAGDYLSAASFLGICGMIAMFGYDGFLYSVGYLAGWIVALFVVAEPLKRLGKFTFADALDSKFKSKGIQLMASISTLVVSVFYLIPQMVGAGSLVTPLLGLPYVAGVLMVGAIVIVIVATAGMTSTTYVQFLKGGLLLVFSLALVILVFSRGFSTTPDQGGDVPYHEFLSIEVISFSDDAVVLADSSYKIINDWKTDGKADGLRFVKLSSANGAESYWRFNSKTMKLEETLYVTKKVDGSELFNGAPKDEAKFFQVGHMSKIAVSSEVDSNTLNPFTFIERIKNSTIIRWNNKVITDGSDKVTVYYQNPTEGRDLLKPGLKFKVDSNKGATTNDKLNFVSLMLALFCGTAALPHILIRYYTVSSPAAARKSTIVAIGAIGLFYILTLYMGLGSAVSGVIDLTNDNMSAPLLAKSFGVFFFAIISALAFATVLGTVSGLIVAASGAVAHDFMDRFLNLKLTDKKKVTAGKISAIVVGCIAMFLGILFKGMNVSYLVGWAFSVAASANLPAIVMLLFWKKTTAKGIAYSIGVGLVSAIGLILLSQETFDKVYHLTNVIAPVPIDNPAIFSMPISFITLIVVSLLTQKKNATGSSEI
ncbi:MAG: cation acetate symporter, partial [Clostridiales bacterium]|nr:cation acetate symporter [Clostridiales bacterium]